MVAPQVRRPAQKTVYPGQGYFRVMETLEDGRTTQETRISLAKAILICQTIGLIDGKGNLNKGFFKTPEPYLNHRSGNRADGFSNEVSYGGMFEGMLYEFVSRAFTNVLVGIDTFPSRNRRIMVVEEAQASTAPEATIKKARPKRVPAVVEEAVPI